MLQILSILTIVILCITVYFDTLTNDLIMDDHQWWKTARLNKFEPIWKVKNLKELRRWIDFRFYSGTTFGVDLQVEHLFRVFLHTSVCVVMFLCFGHDLIAFCAACLYAVNPINNQTSLWLNGRRYTVNIVLVLLMLLVGQNGLIFYYLTGLFQVSAFFAPILLWNNSPWALIAIGSFVLFGWETIKRKVTERSEEMSEGDLKTFKWSRLIVSTKIYGFYFWKMLFPGKCFMIYPNLFYWGKTQEGQRDAYSLNRNFYFGLLALTCTCYIGFYLPHQYICFWIFMALSIFQWCALIPVTQVVADRYMSLPNVFMMFFLSYFINTFCGPFIVILFFIYYLLALREVKLMYKDLTHFYDYHITALPHIQWPLSLLIEELEIEGKFNDASRVLSYGLQYNPNNYQLLMQGAILLLQKGKIKEASELIDRAEKNMFIGKEEQSRKEIKDLRDIFRIIRSNVPVPPKK